MLLNVVHDRLDEVLDGLEDAAPNALVGNLTKPAFHQVEPRTARRREMDMESGMPFEPSDDLGVFMRSIIIDNQMEMKSLRGFVVDLLEEFDPLLMAMALHARADEPALGQLERGEQGVVPLRL